MNFHENLSSGSRTVPCGETRHDEANSRFSQFCESGKNGWNRKMY